MGRGIFLLCNSLRDRHLRLTVNLTSVAPGTPCLLSPHRLVSKVLLADHPYCPGKIIDFACVIALASPDPLGSCIAWRHFLVVRYSEANFLTGCFQSDSSCARPWAERQEREAALACTLLNRMQVMGWPQSYPVG
jgi:hypothetical protein